MMDKVTVNIREPQRMTAQFGGVKVIERGGGTTDYDKLTNKPTLNGVEISGDKTSKDYGIECLIPPGGSVGDLVVKTGEGTGWVTPANDLAGDNTRPITASAVDTIVGNINALLATI